MEPVLPQGTVGFHAPVDVLMQTMATLSGEAWRRSLGTHGQEDFQGVEGTLKEARQMTARPLFSEHLNPEKRRPSHGGMGPGRRRPRFGYWLNS